MNTVNPPPEIDYDGFQEEHPNFALLAELLAETDGQVTRLLDLMDGQDDYPSSQWIDKLFTRYPWVNGFIVTDADGNIIDRHPEHPLKRISAPLSFTAEWRNTFVKTALDPSELGDELYISTPYFEGADFKGLLIVHFDPTRLMADFCPQPDKLIFVDPGAAVFSLDPALDKAAVLALPWEEVLKEEVQGYVEVNGKHYSWLARYIGKDRFVYLTESIDPNLPVEESFWSF
ncbi:MAG: hypothetical protein ACNI27_09630 [Desulfovibrio sp.]